MRRRDKLPRTLLPLALACVAWASADATAQERGERGTARRGAVVNFAEAARQEALAPSAAPLPEPAAVQPPRPLPAEPPLDSSLAVRETASAKASPAAAATSALVASPGPAQSFLGSADNTTTVPPDTHGAVGPNHLVVGLNGGFLTGTTNAGLRVMDRAGNNVSTVALTTFFGGRSATPDTPNPRGLVINSRAFDPRVLFDPYAQRWIVVAATDSFALSSSIVFAVSQTSDPTGNWNLYQRDVDASTDTQTALWADYPSVGFNKNWLVVQLNMFPVSSGSFASHTYAFDKAKLYAGGPGDFTRFTSTTGTQVPAVTLDAAAESISLVASLNGTQLRVYRITGPVGSEQLTTVATVQGAESWGTGAGELGPQLESSRRLAANDHRLQNVVYRNGSLWLAHTIFLPFGSTAARSAIQWWQLDANTGAVVQRGRIDDPTGASSYAFPSIAVNKDNDALVGYSRFSRRQFVSAEYSFRAASDPAGTMREGVIAKRGEGPYVKTFSGTTNRWGDYSATVVDPANDTDMWTLQEFAGASVGAGNGSGRWAVWWARVSPTGAPSSQVDPIRMSLAATSRTAVESAGKVEIPVARAGDVGAAALIDYATTPGTASDRTDYLTAGGTLRFAPGETTKNITVFLVNDAFVEPNETFTVTLSNPRNGALEGPTTATVTVTSDDATPGPNPVREATFDADFFVRQHYLDFFNREADQPGLDFWKGQITSCGTDAGCLDVRKQNVSAAFFVSIEFQETGFLIYKTYGAAFGTQRVGGRVPVTLQEFLPDTQRIGSGLIVGQGPWQAQIEANKVAFFEDFVSRPQFLAQYPDTMSPNVFVDTLRANVGADAITLTERNQLISELVLGIRTRGQVLRVFAENSTFHAAEKNRAFVLMQYFGYLRRNPPDAPELNLDYAGYNFWLGKLNEHQGNYITAQMVRSFIVSAEYQQRFGQ